MSITIHPEVAAEALGVDVNSLRLWLRDGASRELSRLAHVIAAATGPSSARIDELDEEFERAFNMLRAAEACDDHYRAEIDRLAEEERVERYGG